MTDTKSQIQENQIISRGINTQTNNRINKQIIINPIQYQAYNNQIAIKQKSLKAAPPQKKAHYTEKNKSKNRFSVSQKTMEWYFLNAKTGVGQKLSIQISIPNSFLLSFKKEREILSRQTKLTEFTANRPSVQTLFRKFRRKKYKLEMWIYTKK